jgi:hypothetical protein
MFYNSGKGLNVNIEPSICIENRQEAIALLNKLIRGEAESADVQPILEALREAIEHNKI